MKKFYLIGFAMIAILTLAACGGHSADKDKKEIKVAVQLESSKDILEIAKKEVKKQGYTIDIMEVSDNVAIMMPFNMTKQMPILHSMNRLWKCSIKKKKQI